jgi:hypothetical protein
MSTVRGNPGEARPTPDPKEATVADSTNARLALVEEHLRAENAHEISGIMATFGSQPKFILNGTHIEGRDGIQSLYESFGFGNAGGFSDLTVEVIHRHVAGDSVILELFLGGRHDAEWQGIPATNRTFRIPACAVITFDGAGKMAGERVYFDGSLMLRQLGVLG